MKQNYIKNNKHWLLLFLTFDVATLLWEECEDETHTPKMGTWEPTGTPETLKFDCRGQNTSHWGIFYIIGKLSKHKCWKWARAIWTSTAQVMAKRKARSQISNLTLDHQKSGIDPTLMRVGGMWHAIGKLSTRAISLL
jgi:hypothetical protein